jgi:hypothetical protein
MPQPRARIAQRVVSGVEFRKIDRRILRDIGMMRRREHVEFFLQLAGIEPWTARLVENSKVIGHAAKLSPQEQWATAFGLVTLKPPFCKSSL